MSTQPLSSTIETPNSAVDPIASRKSDGEPECGSTSDDESCDEGSLERFDEYGDWKDDYADAVGISRWREL